MAGMHNPTAGATASKAKVGSSQPSEASFKRKRGVFQKDCKYIPSNGQENPPFAYLYISNLILFSSKNLVIAHLSYVVVTVEQHEFYRMLLL